MEGGGGGEDGVGGGKGKRKRKRKKEREKKKKLSQTLQILISSKKSLIPLNSILTSIIILSSLMTPSGLVRVLFIGGSSVDSVSQSFVTHSLNDQFTPWRERERGVRWEEERGRGREEERGRGREEERGGKKRGGGGGGGGGGGCT